MKNFPEYKQPLFWKGVVEDIYDPLELGRVRVRIFGLHDEQIEEADFRGIPTDKLPWTLPSHSIDSACMSGIGKSPTGLLQGSIVWGLTLDGEDFQQLMVCGTLPSIRQEPANPEIGFNDPDGEFPKESNILEPDTHRLARGRNPESSTDTKAEKMDLTHVQSKADRRLTVIPIAFGGTWDEPEMVTYIDPEYPHNKVQCFETNPLEHPDHGHVVEYDTTEGFEGIRTWCKSGAFDDWTQEGERIIKTPSNFYITVEEGHLCMYVQGGSINMTAEEDIRLYAKQNMGIQVDGDFKLGVAGNIEIDAGGIIDIDGSTTAIHG